MQNSSADMAVRQGSSGVSIPHFILADALCPFFTVGMLGILLKKWGLAAPAGGWNADTVLKMRELYQKKTAYYGKDLQLLAEKRHALAVVAALDATLVQAIVAVQKRLGAARGIPQQIWLAIYTGDEVPAEGLGDALDEVAAALRMLIFDMTWFRTRSASAQALLFLCMTGDLIHFGTVWPAAAELLRADADDELQLHVRCREYALCRMLRGQAWEKGEKDFLRPHECTALEGFAAFLQGKSEKAHALLVQARTELRKVTKKKNARLNAPESFALCISGIAAGEDIAAITKEVKQALNGTGQSADEKGWRALLDLCCQQQKVKDKDYPEPLRLLSSRPQSSTFASILYFQACAARGMTGWLPACLALRNSLLDILPLAAAMLDDALVAGGYQGKVSAAHALPHANILKMLTAAPVWKNQLAALQNIFGKKKSKGKSARLVWQLDSEELIASPRLQTCNAAGKWTAGRPVAVKKMLEESAELNCMTAQDKQVAATFIHAEGYYGGERYRFDAVRGLPLLAGHPLLFDTAGNAVQLREEPVELVLADSADGCLVTLSARPAFYLPVSLEKEADGLWTVRVFSKEQLALNDLIGSKGMALPREAVPVLLDTVRDLSACLPVRVEMQAETRPAESLPVVQIRQAGPVFLVEIKVRPFAVAGSPVYPPATGEPEPLYAVDGQSLRARRNFAEERAAAEQLLALCPTLADARNEEWHWSTDEHALLLELLSELRDAGERCAVEWPQGQRLRVCGEVSRPAITVRGGSAKDWLTLEGEVRISADRVMPLAMLLDRMDSLDGRFLPLDDEEFLALTEDVKRAMQRLRLLTLRDKKGGRTLHPLAGAAVEDICEGMAFDRRGEWLTTMGRMQEAFACTPDIPAALNGELRPYQIEGVNWLYRLARWGVGACLADEMGLGKTVQTIALLLDKAKEGPCLIIAPTSVCPNWERELGGFAPTLEIVRLNAVKDRAQTVADMKAGQVLVAGYGLLQGEQALFASRTWSMAVFDEAQALKNAVTKRAKAADAVSAAFKLALTGTPIENNLDDLWSLFNIINPGLLGTKKDFHIRFAQAAEGGAASSTLKKLIKPFILRRLKRQVADDLPPRTDQTIVIEPTEKETAFYEALRQRALQELEAQQEGDSAGAKGRRFVILRELTQLRLACCHASLLGAEAKAVVEAVSSKMQCFLDLVDEARSGGHKVLAFSQFVKHLELARAALAQRGIPYQYLDGSRSEEDRRKSVDAFQAGQGDVFLISLKAGGQGLNLTAADCVIHLDPWWNPAVEDQATDRAHRIGQRRAVTVYRLVMGHTVEEKILALHGRKRELAADFLEGADSAAVQPLTEEELLDLLR